ncbi:hypothetical protein, partial [Streptomyces sp. SID486]|uniref:hypothetical protein n=1 Tax=Streptomyces sp. SID486 TaxID=2690264 RepID=UPI001F2EBCF1
MDGTSACAGGRTAADRHATVVSAVGVGRTARRAAHARAGLRKATPPPGSVPGPGRSRAARARLAAAPA